MTTLQEEYNSINNFDIKLDGIFSELDHNIYNINKEINKIASNIDLYEKTRDFLLLVSEYSRKRIKEHFEKYVTFILQFVLGEDYRFIIEWSTTTKTPSVDFLVETSYCNGDKLSVSAEDSKGGGICDVVSFALRIAFLTLLNNNSTIFLDETFSQLSDGNLFNTSILLKELSNKFGFQFMFVTHSVNSPFVDNADSVFSVVLDNYTSKVTKI